MMKKLLLLFVAVIAVTLSACSKDDGGYAASSFPQLSGSYKHQSNSLIKEYWFFGKTRRATNKTYTWSETFNQWRLYIDNDYEWEVSGQTFRQKLWDSSFDEYTDHDFEFIDASNFKIDGVLFTREEL